MQRTLLCLTGLVACSVTAGPELPVLDQYQDAGVEFHDHSVEHISSLAEFLQWAGKAREPAQVKFIIRGFDRAQWTMHLLDSRFYSMHDEWSWFRLLNGQPIPGYQLHGRNVEPMKGLSFATVAEAVAWARNQTTLPWDLKFYGNRLYSQNFYDHSWILDRFFGIGTVLYYSADPRRPRPGELWLFDLEFGDTPDEGTLATFFERLEQSLPDAARGTLLFLARSMEQRKLGAYLKSKGHPLGARIISYDDLIIPGESRSYNPGVAAGRVRIVRAGQSPIGLLQPTDVTILEEVPDDIPPVAAIISSVPQTPLAHVALLARSRGTPNVYVAYASSDPQLAVWAWYHRPVVLQVTDDSWRIKEMTCCDGLPEAEWKKCVSTRAGQWERYQAMLSPRPVTIQQVDLKSAPELLDPLDYTMSDMPSLVPLVGGKAAGFVALHAYPEVDIPDEPIALTVKGYSDFLDFSGLRTTLKLMIDSSDFRADLRVRLLLLEGRDAFDAVMGKSEPTFVASFEAKHPPSTVLGWIHAHGGVRRLIMDLPIQDGYVERVTELLRKRFAKLAPTQGIRLRSSSSAEDIDGFNGAGLYVSHTAYLYPEVMSGPKHNKTVEVAIRKVWASYWLLGAFEERSAAGIPHLSGNMGAVAHPVFDDDRELMNGVATLELVRRSEGTATKLIAVSQKGSLSVTNPGGSAALPEIDEVRSSGGGGPVIARVRWSTEAPGQQLLSDGELLWLHQVLGRMASDWLDVRNAYLPEPQHWRAITIDVEYRRMAEGWPTLANGTKNPERFVLKQARTLENPIRVDATTESMPFPRDLLSRTFRVETRTCTLGNEKVEATELYTDPTRPEPFDHGRVPFTAWVKVYGLGVAVMHTQAHISHPGMETSGLWSLEVRPFAPDAAGFERIMIASNGDWSLSAKGSTNSGKGAVCGVTHVWWESPLAYLLGLLDAP